MSSSSPGQRGVTWDDVANLAEREAYELVRGKPREARSVFAPTDFDGISAEMARDRTMTLSFLWEEYAALAARNGERPYMHSRFCELHRNRCSSHEVAATRRYVPGDIGELDWDGKSMEAVDDVTGESCPAWLFVACLPYSQMTFVEACPRMDVERWCQASADAFAFFEVAPRLIVIDNLKTGVARHASEEIVLNRTCREFAERFNVAVVPHAVGRPRSKGSVESGVGKIADKIRNMLRGQAFFTFDELNDAIVEKLHDLNSRSFQKKAGSRWEKFVESEVTVPANCHACCTQDGVYCSVPHRLVGQAVQAGWTGRVFEVFCDGERVASHVRNMAPPKGERVADPAHRPGNHADFPDHDSAWLRKEAGATGPSTPAVVESLLAAGIAEGQGWHWCEKLLSKRDGIGADAVEEACSVALKVTPRPSCKTVNALIRNREPRKAAGNRPEGDAYANPQVQMTGGTMLKQQTITKLKRLRLEAAVEAAEAMNGADSRLSREEWFEVIVDHVYEVKMAKKIDNLIRGAHFSCPDACVEDVIFAEDRRLDVGLIDSLAAGTYITKGRNVILMGAAGAGSSTTGC